MKGRVYLLTMGFNLKDEEEVKLYLKNLGIEYRFGCFKEKKPEVCHLLGDFFEAINKEFEKASRIYKSNCDDYNFGRSCHKYGSYSLVGKGGVKQDSEVSHEYFKKACELGEQKACFNDAILNLYDTQFSRKEKDHKLGISFLNKCCEANDALCCYYYSSLYITGLENGHVEKDLKKAFVYALKSCELGNVQSCANVSQMYRRGEGVEKNEGLADKYKKRTLELKMEYETQAQLEFQQGV